MLDWRYVDTSSVVKIKKDLPEGYYACVENGGEIVIRNLKEESKQWGGARTDVYDLIEDGTDYPYGLSWNIQYMEMYHWGESAPFRCDYEKKGCYIKSDDKVVVDVGANIGIFTRLALERGVEKVYAFEPSFDAFRCLMLNVDSSKVVPYKACVTDVSGFTDVTITPSTYPMAVVVRDNTPIAEVDTVPCYTMNDLIDLQIIPTPIDFLKIDIEGSEVEMFEGLTDENLANIDRLAMEAHLAPDSGMNRNDEVMGVLERVCQSFDQSFQVSYAQEGGKEAYRTRIINAWRD